MVEAGFEVWPYDQAVADWAAAAYAQAQTINTTERRHGRTWFVGVDALGNGADGRIGDVAWPHRAMSETWHRAQLSIVYPGYPQQDPDESDAAHRFRVRRDAAHLDGLLPEGPDKRRHLLEPHAFILGMPLNAVRASPLVVWAGSHLIIARTFKIAFAGVPAHAWGDIDVTDIYKDARQEVFDTCERVEVPVGVGEVSYMHRHLIHGVAPWEGPPVTEGRMIAYFRPHLTDVADWL